MSDDEAEELLREAARLRTVNKSLRVINAELLAALEDIADYGGSTDGVKAVARDAIAKAKGG